MYRTTRLGCFGQVTSSFTVLQPGATIHQLYRIELRFKESQNLCIRLVLGFLVAMTTFSVSASYTFYSSLDCEGTNLGVFESIEDGKNAGGFSYREIDEDDCKNTIDEEVVVTAHPNECTGRWDINCYCPQSLLLVGIGSECRIFDDSPIVPPPAPSVPRIPDPPDSAPTVVYSVGFCQRPVGWDSFTLFSSLPEDIQDYLILNFPHMDVVIRSSESTENHKKSFFADSLSDALRKYLVYYDSDGENITYISGSVRISNTDDGFCHSTSTTNEFYEEIENRIAPSQEFNWNKYHLVERNCLLWSGQVLE